MASAYLEELRQDHPDLPSLSQVKSPKTVKTLAWVLVVMFVVSLALMIFSPWQQFVTGSGQVTALQPMERQQTIDAPVDGRIVKWHVIEGSKVRKGDVIVEIVDNDPNFFARLNEQKRSIECRAVAALDRRNAVDARIRDLTNSRDEQLNAARARVETARDRVRQSEQAVDSVRAKVTQNEQQLQRRKAGFKGGIASQRDLEVAQADYDSSTADLKRAEASLAEARNSLQAFEADFKKADADTSATLQSERGARASAQSEIETQNVALQDIDVKVSRQLLQRVTAPSDGTVFRLLVQPNAEVLKAGEPIATFVPDLQDYMVETFVDGNDMPLITPGRHVRVQFEGWPAVPFVGWPSVAIGTFGGTVFLIDPTNRADGKFRVMVVPDPKDERWPSQRFLRQGVRANAFVLLDTVPLGFELWRRLNGFPPVVQVAEPAAKGGKK